MRRIVPTAPGRDRASQATILSGWRGWSREAVLLLGFVCVVLAGVFSVLLPELADEPEPVSRAAHAESE